jgi:hypothetical protein
MTNDDHMKLMAKLNAEAMGMLAGFRSTRAPDEVAMLLAILHAKLCEASMSPDGYDAAVDHHAEVVKGMLATRKAS